LRPGPAPSSSVKFPVWSRKGSRGLGTVFSCTEQARNSQYVGFGATHSSASSFVEVFRLRGYGEVTLHERSVGFILEVEVWILLDREGREQQASTTLTWQKMKKKLDTRFPAVSLQTLAL